jgi:hypothetical protein
VPGTTGTGGIAGGTAGIGGGIGGSGTMTASERVAVLDGQLGRGYEDFDGMILDERARAQRESNAVGSDPAGLYDNPANQPGGQGQSGGGSGQLPGVTLPGEGGVLAGTGREQGSGATPQTGGSGGSVGGLQGGDSSAEEAYPVPDDIPSGNNDDVVARQIREAAMNEPDPELREALWDEYRRYTGISE